MIGRQMGTTILKKIPRMLHPSMKAASSMSLDSERK